MDRARAILVHASGMADPRGDPGFWEDWKVCTSLGTAAPAVCSLSVGPLLVWAAELPCLVSPPVACSALVWAEQGRLLALWQ